MRSRPSLWPFSGQPSAPAEPSSSTSPIATSTIPPLIICEGFLSAAQSVVWGNEFRTYLGVGHQQLLDQIGPSSSAASASPRKRRSGLGSDRPVVFAPIGPVSSLHDRACELFYALRGGVVDYGEQHAREHGHSRFGREYRESLCPSWGPRGGRDGLPAHFLGHSLGGPTILKLQQLLRTGFFDHSLGISKQEGWAAEDLILSITSVSSPFRGTPLVYSLGSEPLPYPKVRMFSFGDMLSKFIHIAAFLDLPFFDAHADAWHFSAKRRKAVKRSQLAGGVAAEPSSSRDARREDDDPESGYGGNELKAQLERAGLKDFLRQLWKSDWAGGRDCAPWDCTFAERDRDRPEDLWGLEVQPRKRRGKTWYRSYAGGMTVAAEGGFHRPESYWSLSPLTFTSHLIGHFDYSKLQPSPSFLPQSAGGEKKQGQTEPVAMAELPSTWWANDGVVPLASQFHPFDCRPDTCRHFGGMPASLPLGKRRKRPQSTDIKLPSPVLTPNSETATLVDVDVGAPPLHANEEDAPSLPSSVTRSESNRSMFGSARSAARIAYFTSLRAINLHDPPLVTPSEEELRSFLPDLTPTTEDTSSRSCNDSKSAPTECDDKMNRVDEDESGFMVQRELLDPRDNQWYTFEIDNLDHTSLCPFWTGSEVQKQFWTGIGLFLASVDRKAGFVVDEGVA